MSLFLFSITVLLEMLNREAGSTDTKVKHFAELDNQTERGSADSINQDPLFEFNHPENESLTEG